MKQLAMSAAILAAFAAGTAGAQTSVTLYGTIDASYENVKAGDLKASRISSGALSGSRWGMKGTEDLGDGLKVNFQLEGGFNVDRGTQGQSSRLFGRQAWVGMAGGFGEVRMGRQYSPQTKVIEAATAMGTSSYALNCALTLNCGPSSSELGSAPIYRVDNSIMYISPDMSGARFQLMYGARADGSESLVEDTREDGRLWGLSIDYSNGPFYVGYGYTDYKLDELPEETIKKHVLGAAYDFGAAKIYALYDRANYEDNAFSPAIDGDVKSFIIGLKVPVGMGAFTLEYGRTKFDEDLDGGFDGDASGFHIGYQHSLSKRTTVYAIYTRVSNGDDFAISGIGSDSGIGTGSNLPAGGESARGLAIGMRHTF